MDSSNTYQIRGTKVFSPYPPQLTPAEHRLVFSLQKIFSPENILADCYFPKPNVHKNQTVSSANLAQIDCLAIGERGIFVFESKDYVGWIYGHGERVHWTQVSAYGHNKHQFYNPIRQNATHIQAITAIFGNLVPIYSIIVFGRESTLKIIDDVPEHCYVCTQNNLNHTIQLIKTSRPKLSKQQICEILRKLQASRIDPTAIIRSDHVQEIPTNTK